VVQKEPEPEPEPPRPQPKPEQPPEETPAAGDVEFSKRAEPTPVKEDPKPAPPTDPAPAENGDTSGDFETGERVGDAGAGVSGGGEISLFGWYQSSVSRALYSTWQRPLLAGLREPLSVLVSFNIQKDGSVANLRVVEPSGVAALDRSALRAVADAAPLPRLPPAWRGSSMTAAYLFQITPEDF
jgi:protein TonB